MTSKTIYCTYLTSYTGNKLPQFYIGSTSVKKIEEGYHGSVSSKKYQKIWTSELKENPHLFKTSIISYHISRQEALEKEEFFHRRLSVVKSDLYINMCYANKGFDSSDSSIRDAISKSKIGKSGWKWSDQQKSDLSAKTKNRIFSENHKKKISETRKNSEYLIQKSIENLPNPQKGSMNGMHKSNRDYSQYEELKRIENIKRSHSMRSKEENKISYSRVKSEEEKQKLSRSMKNRPIVKVCIIELRKEIDKANYIKWLRKNHPEDDIY